MEVIKWNSARISVTVGKFGIAGGFFVGAAMGSPKDQCDKCFKYAINLVF